jgi:Na+/H+ antiporter
VHLAFEWVGLLVVAAAAAGIASRVGLSAPLLLTALGLVLSFVPHMPTPALEPEVVLVGILPPLLYATAIRTPYVDLRRNRRPITLLSVGLVVVTAFAVALVVRWIVPDINFLAALALGAVVAPPDAVAAVAVARRVRMPRKVVTLLEGESLLNDATALVLLRTATAAGAVTLLGTGADFLRAVAVGALAGWVVAELVSLVRRRVDEPVLDTALSLFAPYLAYLVSEVEPLHGSGVIGVVVAGLILGHRSPEIQSASSRVTERIIWRTVQFLLESIVFLLIGLQLKELVLDAIESPAMRNSEVFLLSIAVLAVVVGVRLAWVWPATYLPRLIPAVARVEPPPPARHVLLLGWAGMRGVVTLAAALSIPDDVPERPALLVAAFTVVVGTLLLNGTTLPWLVRVLRIQGPDPQQDALTEALIQQKARHAAVERLEKEAGTSDRTEVVAGLRDWGLRVENAAWERLGAVDADRETPAAAFHRLRVAMLDAERQVLTDIRNKGAVPADVVERVLERVDQEEAMLEGFSEAPVAVVRDHDDPATMDGATGHDHKIVRNARCEHLEDRPEMVRPETAPDACPDCLELGEPSWVHLRMCLDCGHIGCCDSSPNRHAQAHFTQTGHPVMRSVELGESWRWCFVDSELG